MRHFTPRLAGLAAVSLLWLVPVAPQAPVASDVALDAAPAVAPAMRRRVAAHMGFLASDAMAGRDTGTPSGDVTARYVASVFEGLGLEPSGDDGFLQPYPLTRAALDEHGTHFELVSGQGREFTLGSDYVPRGGGYDGLDTTAEVVFVGWGLPDEESGFDPYVGLDVQGRFALALMGSPPGEEGGRRRGGAWRAQQEAAELHGAKGLLLAAVPGDERAEQTLGWVRRSVTTPSLRLGAPTGDDEVFPRVYLSAATAAALFEAAGNHLPVEAEAFAADPHQQGYRMDGLKLRLVIRNAVDVLVAHNVAALLPGSDPELAHEVVVLSAHMDHVGIDGDGQVFNGADDNASGTTALMAVAEAMVDAPLAPRRSVLFLAVSGEEKGLLGSRWWVEHPTWPLADVVADINADMVGRNDPFALGATPSPEHPEYNTLVAKAVELGPAAGLEVRFVAGEGDYERKVDTYYSRSDHKNFSDAGIPVVFFFAGEHADYHRVTDTLEKIDLDKIARVVGLVSALATAVANDDARPERLVDG